MKNFLLILVVISLSGCGIFGRKEIEVVTYEKMIVPDVPAQLFAKCTMSEPPDRKDLLLDNIPMKTVNGVKEIDYPALAVIITKQKSQLSDFSTKLMLDISLCNNKLQNVQKILLETKRKANEANAEVEAKK